jgi:hypothetical protein
VPKMRTCVDVINGGGDVKFHERGIFAV